jgi:ACS family allantoate permease-like MFS transporter
MVRFPCLLSYILPVPHSPREAIFTMATSAPVTDDQLSTSDTKQPVTTQHDATTHTKTGLDTALNLLKETDGVRQPLDKEAEKRLLRKIDLHIMPLICIVYFLQYIDKTAISYASVTGIQASANLHGNQFNWVASIFFFGSV